MNFDGRLYDIDLLEVNEKSECVYTKLLILSNINTEKVWNGELVNIDIFNILKLSITRKIEIYGVYKDVNDKIGSQCNNKEIEEHLKLIEIIKTNKHRNVNKFIEMLQNDLDEFIITQNYVKTMVFNIKKAIVQYFNDELKECLFDELDKIIRINVKYTTTEMIQIMNSINEKERHENVLLYISCYKEKFARQAYYKDETVELEEETFVEKSLNICIGFFIGIVILLLLNICPFSISARLLIVSSFVIVFAKMLVIVENKNKMLNNEKIKKIFDKNNLTIIQSDNFDSDKCVYNIRENEFITNFMIHLGT
uniref:Uncharacterized protein n=1 Tax=viral metagenome TaxID=1070528 RepID=A0A6C0JQ13_9ZZZZ